MRIALEQACHKLGLVDGPSPKPDAFVIDISDNDNDDDAAAIPANADRGDIEQDIGGTRGKSLGAKGDVRQPVRGLSFTEKFPPLTELELYTGGLPYDENHVSMYQYLCSQHKNITFKVESHGASADSLWKFDIFGM